MTEHKVFPGKVYAVTCAAGCTITDNKGYTLGKCEAGKQTIVVATSDKLLTSADALVTATFNAAPALGSGSGGGVEIKFDTTPKSGSTNAVTSGGVYDVCYARFLKLGSGAKTYNYSLALGEGANAAMWRAVVVGEYTEATKNGGIAIGSHAKTKGAESTVIGRSTTVNDSGVTAFGNMTSDESVQTLFYIIAAGSPLSVTYEDGAACLGYVVKEKNGNVLECGTRKLSELLTNNTAFAPAAMDLDAPAPTPFLPTGIMEPIEFPEDLTE